MRRATSIRAISEASHVRILCTRAHWRRRRRRRLHGRHLAAQFGSPRGERFYFWKSIIRRRPRGVSVRRDVLALSGSRVSFSSRQRYRQSCVARRVTVEPGGCIRGARQPPSEIVTLESNANLHGRQARRPTRRLHARQTTRQVVSRRLR